MPPFEVVFSSRANADLAKIKKYLKQNGFNPEILAEIIERAKETLSNRPLSNTIITVEGEPEIRKVLILKKNSVFYKMTGRTVQIIAIRAGGMSKDL